MYKYKFKQTEAFKKMGAKYARTPTVLLEFNWIKKEKYQILKDKIEKAKQRN